MGVPTSRLERRSRMHDHSVGRRTTRTRSTISAAPGHSGLSRRRTGIGGSPPFYSRKLGVGMSPIDVQTRLPDGRQPLNALWRQR
jgi:hypothetical protein